MGASGLSRRCECWRLKGEVGEEDVTEIQRGGGGKRVGERCHSVRFTISTSKLLIVNYLVSNACNTESVV